MDRKPEEQCLKFDREGHKHGGTDGALAVYERTTDFEVILMSSLFQSNTISSFCRSLQTIS